MTKPLSDLEALRAQEMLVQRATEGLDDAEAAELDRLEAGDVETFDLAAAAIAVATTPREPMPAEVAARVLAGALRPAVAGPAAAATSPSTAPAVPAVAAELPSRRTRPPGRSRGAATIAIGDAPAAAPRRLPAAVRWGAPALGWAAAAVFAAIAWSRGPDRPAPASDPAAERRALLGASATTSDVVSAILVPGPDPNGRAARGDVVWSRQLQRGSVRLVGFVSNDPRAGRYQLWIVDGARGAGVAVDGGLFDVGPSGEVIVTIDPLIPVVDPTGFLITLESPLGAIVSDRARLVASATVAP